MCVDAKHDLTQRLKIASSWKSAFLQIDARVPYTDRYIGLQISFIRSSQDLFSDLHWTASSYVSNLYSHLILL